MTKKTRVIRSWATASLLSGLALVPSLPVAWAQSGVGTSVQPSAVPVQAPPAVTQTLLDKARALEARGRSDLAEQTWQQVLLADPSNAEALGGLARTSKLNGDEVLAKVYLKRLLSLDAKDPHKAATLAKVDEATPHADQAMVLQQAAKLAEAGQYTDAMVQYRAVFGATPPSGAWGLAYYETEAATGDGRPHAIAGLRELTTKSPDDPRYAVALGRVLTLDPKTREEGRGILTRYPHDTHAVEALGQALLWDVANPALAPQIRAYLAIHSDPPLGRALAATPQGGGPASGRGSETRTTRPAGAERQADLAADAGYRALNAQQIDEAERRFKAALALSPETPRAIAGMGYVRMQQANFPGAISFLEQAHQQLQDDAGVNAALDTARFWFNMGEAAIALEANDLTNAEKLYRAALALRPGQPDALAGLAGTLLKAEQAAAAVPLFEQAVQAKPSAAEAWKGLFNAQLDAGNAAQALATEQRMPGAVRAQLMQDPVYLRTLASAYTAVGRDADAQRVLQTALNLPFPADSNGLKIDTQLTYAGILFAANRMEQAAGLYRQVLAADHANTAAWEGLVRAIHALGQDASAMQTVESMPPASYALAMSDPGFVATVAAIYQAENKLDVAQSLLEKAIAQQTTTGQKPSAGMQLELASMYLQRGTPQLAEPLYRQVLADHPDSPEAWAGLLATLHAAGRDKDAVAEVQHMPAQARAALERNLGFLVTMASVYTGVGQPQDASVFLNRVQLYYAAQHALPPADLEIQNAWLLYNAVNDAGLYRQLMGLGERGDLTDAQKHSVQTIWSNWALRRANQASAAGNPQRALAILVAAARTFPDSPEVVRALANGYARAGQPGEAVQLYKAQGMASASVEDYRAAVGAALAAGDKKDAETWLHAAQTARPGDPQILFLAAKFEQSRGNTPRAIDYYHASLKAMPEDAKAPGGSVLASLMRLPNAEEAQDLSTLLAPTNAETTPTSVDPAFSAGSGGGPVPAAVGPLLDPGGNVVPAFMSNPRPRPEPAPTSQTGKGRLRDYVPQARLADPPMGKYGPASRAEVERVVRYAVALALGEPAARPLIAQAAAGHVARSTAAKPELSVEPALPPQADAAILSAQAFERRQITRLTQQASLLPPQPRPREHADEPSSPESPVLNPPPAEPAPASSADAGDVQISSAAVTPGQGSTGRVIPVQLGDPTPHPQLPLAEVTDVLPTARYLANARVQEAISSHPDIAAAQAEEIRRHQSDPDFGSGRVTVDARLDATDARTQNVVYEGPQGQAAPLVAQPATPPPAAPSKGAVPDTGKQQYQQPRVPRSSASTAPGRTPGRTTVTPSPEPAVPVSATVVDVPEPQPAPTGTAQIYPPAIGLPYPTLRGGDSTAHGGPPLVVKPGSTTLREQAERELAALEGSYSGWIGATGRVRYRSGTPGLDRLYDVESPIEASAVIAQSVRLTVIPRGIFLNSGTFSPGTFTGQSGMPYLGTFATAAVTPPGRQYAAGVGGELQLTTRNFGIAAGYTPYEFPVANITGRVRWQPGGSHLTLFGAREPVKDTELSYAGLVDPGSSTPTHSGNLWGGVMSTMGGVRFDLGGDSASFYLSGDGGILHGYHVENNLKYEGSAGANFRLKQWPTAGSLTLGGTLFGMHYDASELGLSYGQGGYFSPNDYVLAAMPVAFRGVHGTKLHYSVAGAVGVQTFHEKAAPYFPIDPGLQAAAQVAPSCTVQQIAAKICGFYASFGETGFNYSTDSEVSYRAGEHWFVGGFVSANNTNHYTSVTGGFFVRYTFLRQPAVESGPAGLFPVDGLRPLRIP